MVTAKKNKNHKKTQKTRTGRKPLLTPALQRKICGIIREGNYAVTAAECCGIRANTICDWVRKSEDPKCPNRKLYAEFATALKKAKAERERRLIGHIARAAIESKTWTAAAWMLERLYPEHWQKRESDNGKGDATRTFAEGIQAALQEMRALTPQPPQQNEGGNDGTDQ